MAIRGESSGIGAWTRSSSRDGLIFVEYGAHFRGVWWPLTLSYNFNYPVRPSKQDLEFNLISKV
jgi:hypothetical protein